MARKTDLSVLKSRSLNELLGLELTITSFEMLIPSTAHVFMRWVSAMGVVELHSIWERFAETRLMIALNHNPKFFLEENEVKGVGSIPKGLSQVLIKGNGKYFDFRSTGDLIDKAKKLVDGNNPFLSLKQTDSAKYLDMISATRNYVVHKSVVSEKAYKSECRRSFGTKSVPEPREFLNAIDNRKNSPKRGEKRILVLLEEVRAIIQRS